jgi:hypothetical protein
VEAGDRVIDSKDEAAETTRATKACLQYLLHGSKGSLCVLLLPHYLCSVHCSALLASSLGFTVGDELENPFYVEVLGYIVLCLLGLGLQNTLNSQSSISVLLKTHTKALFKIVWSSTILD